MANTLSHRARCALIAVLGCAGAPLAHGAGNVPADAYAWGENVGWINFAPTSGPGVTVGDLHVSGYAWSENAGWIDLWPIAGGVINDGGTLSGYAWGINLGWINFKPPVSGVTIDASGKFTGWAWGENTGWINFATQSPVTTTWRFSDLIFADGFE